MYQYAVAERKLLRVVEPVKVAEGVVATLLPDAEIPVTVAYASLAEDVSLALTVLLVDQGSATALVTSLLSGLAVAA